MLSEQNEKIVEFGIGGLCNYCLGRVGFKLRWLHHCVPQQQRILIGARPWLCVSVSVKKSDAILMSVLKLLFQNIFWTLYYYCLGRVGLNSDGYIFVYHNNRGS